MEIGRAFFARPSVGRTLGRSGTTYIFTNYLSAISHTWASGPGTGTAVSWPVGLGAKKSAGVAAIVKILPGSLGYFELSYAESNLLPYAAIENETGASSHRSQVTSPRPQP